MRFVALRASLMHDRLLPRGRDEDPYEVLPEGMDLVRHTSALADAARKASLLRDRVVECPAEVRFRAPEDLARV